MLSRIDGCTDCCIFGSLLKGEIEGDCLVGVSVVLRAFLFCLLTVPIPSSLLIHMRPFIADIRFLQIPMIDVRLRACTKMRDVRLTESKTTSTVPPRG